MTKSIENTNSVKQPEEWKPIPGYDGKYEVSNWGRVRSFKRQKERILSPIQKYDGYYRVQLCKDSRVKELLVHRLVAEAFISNPSKLSQVNHKDEDKRNNYVMNLEWCTPGYNLTYGTRMERISKRVVQLDKGGNFIAEFESINEAARRTGIAPTSICYCCQHKPSYKSAKGFIFMYKDEYLNTQTQQDK